AAIRAGKGVYCEKPLTYSVYEARKLAQAAREAKVATQMGNQGHSSDDIRRAVEWVRDVAIGKIRKVYAWAGENRIPQYTERPKETPPVPEGLHWDLWLGPAESRPFHPAYAPLLWHYWWDFGNARLGNFGCHTLDTAVWALNLEHPTLVEASSTQLNKETTPLASACHWKFPARGALPPVDLYWYDGGIRPPRPDCLELERSLPRNGGSLLVGEHGAILSGIWSGSPRIIPEKKMREYTLPPATILRSRGHHRDWIDACKGGPPASSNFDNAARLTEIVLLGVVAIRTATTLHWDAANMKTTNAPEVDPILHGFHRKGWEI
ncbi:MAG: Gfo/Idh/MocA family protein, partial [Planctomycetota bacterium]